VCDLNFSGYLGRVYGGGALFFVHCTRKSNLILDDVVKTLFVSARWLMRKGSGGGGGCR
jgi:hypothetical protein